MISRLTRLFKGSEPKLGEIPKNYIAKFLPQNPIIIEAGAHIGVDTLEMSTLWPLGHIHAFEPIPAIFQTLKENTSKTRNVTCYPLALSDSNGTAEIFVSGGTSDGSSSLLAPKEHLIEHPNVTFTTKIEVSTITLDKWVVDESIRRIDFLWLDLQGYEFNVLKASPEILESVLVIHTEVSLKHIYEDAPLYPELRQWIESKGFEVRFEALPWNDAGNVLFVRRS
jgi:FkbM family methyltransferase